MHSDYPDIPHLLAPRLRTDDPPSDDDTRSRVVDMCNAFCANLNCIQGYCARHCMLRYFYILPGLQNYRSGILTYARHH